MFRILELRDISCIFNMSGIVNTGSTCYRNAVLQIMHYAPGLWVWMKAVPHKTVMCIEILRLLNMMDKSSDPINPIEFNALVDKNPTYANGIGADAAEFMAFLSLNLDRDGKSGWISLNLTNFRKTGIKELLQQLKSVSVPMVTVYVYRRTADNTLLTDAVSIPNQVTIADGTELRLHGIITHIGSSASYGHFRALVKGAFGCWVSYNDASVLRADQAPKEINECAILVAYVPAENYSGSVFSHCFGGSARKQK